MATWLWLVGFWLLVSGVWLLASGFWLLASGFWLLAVSSNIYTVLFLTIAINRPSFNHGAMTTSVLCKRSRADWLAGVEVEERGE